MTKTLWGMLICALMLFGWLAGYRQGKRQGTVHRIYVLYDSSGHWGQEIDCTGYKWEEK